MKQTIYLLTGLLILSACQESENPTDKSEVNQSIELIDSTKISEVNNEADIDIDLSHLEGNSYLALFNTSTNNSVLIEPACLSECPSVSFKQLEHDKIAFHCGQEFMDYKITEASEENNLIRFVLDGKIQLDVEQLEATEENPFEHIQISLSDFHQLYMGYYDDSITSINSEKLIMMLNNESNREVLKNQNRWTAVPCPEDMFD